MARGEEDTEGAAHLMFDKSTYGSITWKAVGVAIDLQRAYWYQTD